MPDGFNLGSLNAVMPTAAIGSYFGQGIGSLLAGKTPYEESISPAMQSYRQYMQQAQQALTEREQAGKEALTGGVERAQVYGEPYRQAGAGALESYLGSLGVGGSPAQQAAQQAFQASPGYQFALQEGLQGVRRGMAGTGLRGSGAEQRALTRYASGLAQQEYGSWQDRLAKLAGLGAETSEMAAGREYGAGGQLATLGLGYGGQLAQLLGTLGQAQAESQLAQAQAESEREASKKGFLSSLGPIGGILSSFI